MAAGERRRAGQRAPVDGSPLGPCGPASRRCRAADASVSRSWRARVEQLDDACPAHREAPQVAVIARPIARPIKRRPGSLLRGPRDHGVERRPRAAHREVAPAPGRIRSMLAGPGDDLRGNRSTVVARPAWLALIRRRSVLGAIAVLEDHLEAPSIVEERVAADLGPAAGQNNAESAQRRAHSVLPSYRAASRYSRSAAGGRGSWRAGWRGGGYAFGELRGAHSAGGLYEDRHYPGPARPRGSGGHIWSPSRAPR